jgi:hypothetical protein
MVQPCADSAAWALAAPPGSGDRIPRSGPGHGRTTCAARLRARRPCTTHRALLWLWSVLAARSGRPGLWCHLPARAPHTPGVPGLFLLAMSPRAASGPGRRRWPVAGRAGPSWPRTRLLPGLPAPVPPCGSRCRARRVRRVGPAIGRRCRGCCHRGSALVGDRVEGGLGHGAGHVRCDQAGHVT